MRNKCQPMVSSRTVAPYDDTVESMKPAATNPTAREYTAPLTLSQAGDSTGERIQLVSSGTGAIS